MSIFSLASLITTEILELSNRVSYSPSSLIESNEKCDYYMLTLARDLLLLDNFYYKLNDE